MDKVTSRQLFKYKRYALLRHDSSTFSGAGLLLELHEAGYEGGTSQHKVFLATRKRAHPAPVMRFEMPSGKHSGGLYGHPL